MSEQWFFRVGDDTIGPLSLEQLREMVARGRVTKMTYVQNGRDGDPIAAGRVPGLFSDDRPAKPTANVAAPLNREHLLPPTPATSASAPTTATNSTNKSQSAPSGTKSTTASKTASTAPAQKVPTPPKAPAAFTPPVATPAFVTPPLPTPPQLPSAADPMAPVAFASLPPISGMNPATPAAQIPIASGTAPMPMTVPIPQTVAAPVVPFVPQPVRTEVPVGSPNVPADDSEVDNGDASADEEEVDEEELEARKGRRKIILIVVALSLFFGSVLGLVAVLMLRGSSSDTETVAEKAETEDTEVAPPVSEEAFKKAYESIERWQNAKVSRKARPKSHAYEIELKHIWSPPSEDPRRIYVEMRIAAPSLAKQPLIYSTWNSSPARGWPGSILVDSSGSVCPLIPIKDTPDTPRQTDPWQLDPGQEVSDVLVFAYPQDDGEFLELLLNFASLDQGNRFHGFRIPVELVATKPFDTNLAIRIEANRSKIRKPGEPPSIEELNKQFERYEKRMQKQEQAQQQP